MVIVDGVADIKGAYAEDDVFRVSLEDTCLEGVDAYPRQRLCVVDDAVLVVGRVTDEISLGDQLKAFNYGAIEIGLETDSLFLIPINGQILLAHSLDFLKVLEIELSLILNGHLLQAHLHIQCLYPPPILHGNRNDQSLLLANEGVMVSYQLLKQLIQTFDDQKLFEAYGELVRSGLEAVDLPRNEFNYLQGEDGLGKTDRAVEVYPSDALLHQLHATVRYVIIR